jgi:alpha-maltose-1-phosphate synthase
LAKITVTSLSPDSSSRLPAYIGGSISHQHQVKQAWPHKSRLHRLFWMGLTFRPNRRKWRDALERETQHRLRTWNDFSALLQADPAVRESDVILQEGLHFESFPAGYSGKCAVYLHGTLSMIINNRKYFDCTMWQPPAAEIAGWMEGEKRVLRRADRIFIGSKFLADVLATDYGVSRDKIAFVGTGQPPLPADAGGATRYSASKNILFVGRDFERKGGETLFQALPEVVAKVPGARLQIVGPRSIPLPAHPAVEFLGRVNDRERLAQLYREAAVFAMPSLYETFGFVFLEAMSRGLPCIGADHFAMPEIIQDKRTGLIVPPADAPRLAEALIWILTHPAEAAEMGAAAREYARTSFSWSAVGANMLGELKLSTS